LQNRLLYNEDFTFKKIEEMEFLKNKETAVNFSSIFNCLQFETVQNTLIKKPKIFSQMLLKSKC